MKTKSLTNKMKLKSLISFENLLGLVLAVLIVFDFKPEKDIQNVINSPPGMIISLVLLVVIFIFMNPIIGLLFLIFLYETVKTQGFLNPSIFSNSENTKSNFLNKLNLANDNDKMQRDSVEYEVINNMAPIVKKTENSGSVFVPHVNDTIAFNEL